MLDWLVELLRDPIMQGIAAIIAIFQVGFGIIKFANPKFGDKVRDWLPKVVRNYVVTHASFLFIGLVVGIAIASRNGTNEIGFPSSPMNEIHGTYEWQWAGENWYGRVTLAQQNGNDVISYARAGSIEKVVLPNESDRIHMNGMLLNLNSGNFVIDDKGVTINLSVEKTDRRTNLRETEIITGDLQQVMCYAGVVYYGDKKNKGDMILVKYSSDVGTDVDDWFRDPNPPWYDYVINK